MMQLPEEMLFMGRDSLPSYLDWVAMNPFPEDSAHLGPWELALDQQQPSQPEGSHLSCSQKMEASYYDNIMEQQRLEPEFFRVGFYGRKFPFFLRVSSFKWSQKLIYNIHIIHIKPYSFPFVCSTECFFLKEWPVNRRHLGLFDWPGYSL